jgi:hypothetical protein
MLLPAGGRVAAVVACVPVATICASLLPLFAPTK